MQKVFSEQSGGLFSFKKYVTSDLDEADFGLENRPRIEIQNRKQYEEE